jgi:hypothetical protein
MKSNLERQQATGENMRTRRKDEEEEEKREIQVKEPKLQRHWEAQQPGGGGGAQELAAAAASAPAAVATKGWTKDSVVIFKLCGPVFAKKRIFKSNIRKELVFGGFQSNGLSGPKRTLNCKQ